MPSAQDYFNTVQSIYIAYYGRPADSSGLLYWADRLAVSNGNLDDIINEFSNSAESLALYGPINNATIGNVVDAMYLAMFGHLPDAAGKAFYVNGFIAGTFTAGTIALNIYDGATGNDAVALNNKEIAANTFTQIQDGRTYADPDFGQGTVFNATYAGTGDANAARAWLAPVLSNPTTIPSEAQTATFIRTSIANPGDPILAPDFVMTASSAGVVEGGTVTFTVTAKNLSDANKTYDYTLSGSGLSAGDIVGGLTGSVTLDATGKGTITVVTVKDATTEPSETVMVMLTGIPAGSQTSDVVSIFDDATGQQFILTPNIDVFVGTDNDDTFTANGATLNPGDNLDGGLPTASDTFNMATGYSSSAQFFSGFFINNVEHGRFTTDGDTILDMSGVFGMQDIYSTNSSMDLTLNSLNNIVDAGIINQTAPNDVTFNYKPAVIAGGSDEQNLHLDGMLAGSSFMADGIENFNVHLDGVPSQFHTLSSNALQVLNVAGANDFDGHHINFPGSGTVNADNDGSFELEYLDFGGSGTFNADNGGDVWIGETDANGPFSFFGNNDGDVDLWDVSVGPGNSVINASGSTGSLYAELDNAAAGGVNFAVTGTNNGDGLDVENGFNAGDSFNGLGGYDTIYANASNLSVNNNAISGVEEAAFYAGTLGVLELNQFDTALALINVQTGTADPVEFRNLENDGSELIHFNNYAANLNGKTIRFDVQNSGYGVATVNMDIVNISGSNTITLQDFDANGGGWNDPVGVLNLGLYDDGGYGEMTVILNPLNALHTLGLEGDADIIITPLTTSNISTVNGGSTTGDVTIDVGVLSNGGSTVVLGTGYDTVYGGSGNDNIDMGLNGDGGYAEGGDGDDVITGGLFGSNTFYGDDGDDTLTGGFWPDYLYGGNGADTLDGNTGDDYLEGNGGSDTLIGGQGADFLFGGLGSDWMAGNLLGDGADGNKDTFFYDNTNQSQGAFTDTLDGFVSGEDFIDLLQAVMAVNPSVFDYNDMIFIGNFAGLAPLLTALSGTGGVEIGYDTINHQVLVDVDGNGDVDGVVDMVIGFTSPPSLQASDFGILNNATTFTAAVIGFDTTVAADSFENHAIDPFGNNIINTLASQLPGAWIATGWGENILNVRTTITVPTDFGPMTDGGLTKMNLAGGTTAPVIGPDQWVDLDVFIGNGGSNFTTGTNGYWWLVQDVHSGSGNDSITLTNYNDNAWTTAGNDNIFLPTYFEGMAYAGDDNDDVWLPGGTFLGSSAVLDGGGQADDEIQVGPGGIVDILAASVSGFAQVEYQGTTDLWITVDQYNGLSNTADPIENGPGFENMTLFGPGSIDADSDLDNIGMGDDSTQTIVLFSDTTNIVGGGTGDTTIVSPSSSPNGSYNGGGGTDTFVQNVTADFTTGPDPTFISVEVLVLNNGADITGMLNSQHNQFTTIIGNDIVFPLDTNSITLDDTFNGMTHNTIETYNLFASAGGQSYSIGGSNQVVNDPSTAFGDIDFLNGVNNTTLNATDAAAVQVVHSFGSNSGLVINTNGGNDTVDLVTFSVGGTQTNLTVNAGAGDDTVTVSNGTGVTINMGDGLDTVNLTNVTGLDLNYQIGLAPDVVNLAGIVSGDIEQVFAGALDYNIANGADLSGLTTNYSTGFGDNVTFATNGSFTLNNTLYDQFAAPVADVTAAGNETITISDTADINAMSFSVVGANQVENYVLSSAGDDQFNLQLAAGETTSFNLNIGAGGNDKITIDNETGEAAVNRLIVTGFNVADDQLRLEFAGLANGTFQEITAANSPTTVGPIGVIEINTVVGSLIGQAGALDVARRRGGRVADRRRARGHGGRYLQPGGVCVRRQCLPVHVCGERQRRRGRWRCYRRRTHRPAQRRGSEYAGSVQLLRLAGQGSRPSGRPPANSGAARKAAPFS